MRFSLYLISLLILSCTPKKEEIMSQDWTTAFEKNTNATPTYFEVIEYYERLCMAHPELCQTTEVGDTDAGFPLHEVVISRGGKTPETAAKEGKVVLFVNNAIHPGESCGVDASMLLARDLVTKEDTLGLLDQVCLVIVPFYNIGGGLNRGAFSRANQNGPEFHGFRGNTKNLDLNRDFIKCDSKNARTFNQLFTKWNAPIFIDNHTSNGADYQYVMTLIATQKDKLQVDLRAHLTDSMLPFVYKKMEDYTYEMTPYVNVDNTPDQGIYAFLDLPRYSSGYAVLHNSISFMPETHMLKPYKDRVWSTYYYMHAMLEHIKDSKAAILTAKKNADEAVQNQKTFEINWSLDASKSESLSFKGYEAKYKTSEVSGLPRLYYDHNQPYTKEIPFFNTFKPSTSIEAPRYYIIPQAYEKVVDRLRWNGVHVQEIQEDSILSTVHKYRIQDYETRPSPYEGHYLHYNIKVEDQVFSNHAVRKGDYLVTVNQIKNRYIVETLEPHAPDSFFAWNFFDGILMQKEYFSPYVFEDTAARLLAEDPSLRAQLDQAISEDPSMAENARAQLLFVYKKSPYYESNTHMVYPVARVF